MSNVSVNLVVANTSLQKTFYNAKDWDVLMYAGSSNQAILIGSGINSNLNSTLAISDSNAVISTDLSVNGVMDATLLRQSGTNLTTLFTSKAGDNMTGSLNITGTVNATSYQQNGSNLSDIYLEKSGGIINGTLNINGSVNTTTIQEAGSNLSSIFINKAGDVVGGLLTVSNLDVKGSLIKNGQSFVPGISACNLSQLITTYPSNGYSNNLITVPTVTTRTVPSKVNVTYGRVELTAHEGISLFAGGNITVFVTHNLGSTNYWVYAIPDDDIAIKVNVQNITANSFGLLVRNTSGSNVGPQGISYQLVQSGSSNLVTLAQPVTILNSNLSLSTTGSNNTTTTFTFSNQAVDPQGYELFYNFVTGSNSRTSLTGSNLVYINTGLSNSLNLVIKATNAYVDDPSKTFSVLLSEIMARLMFSVSPSSSYTSTVDLFAQNLTLRVVTTGDSAFFLRNAPGAKTLYLWNVRHVNGPGGESVIVQNTTTIDANGIWQNEERITYAQGNIQSDGSSTNLLKLTPSEFIWTREDGTFLYKFLNRFNTGNAADRALLIETSANISITTV